MFTTEQVRRAAEILRQQANGEGPVLGFSFGSQEEGVTLDFDDTREVAVMSLEAFTEALNQVLSNPPEKATLRVVRGS